MKFTRLILSCSGLSFGCAIAFSAAAQTVTLFGSSAPKSPLDPDTNAVTLGVKFYSTQVGTIAGIRFYRAAKNRSGYVARLYKVDGTMLASKSVTSEPCGSVPCWEELDFASPISIAANTTYVAAYFVSGGQYAGDNNGLANGAINGPLVAPASSQVGGNGVYHYGGSIGFPNQTYQASNYWVDVSFTPSVQVPMLSLSFTPSNPSIPSNTPAGAVVATANATWSNGAAFTGTYGFAAPNSNDHGTFAIANSNQIIVDPAGPGVGADGGTTQNITVVATQQ